MSWITQVFESSEFGIAVLPVSLLLGILTAVSSCCNIGIIAAVAGYAGCRDESFSHRDALFTSIFFLVGITASLAILGLLIGYFGQLAQTNLGRYGTILAGLAAIFFGIAALDLLPFKTPSVNLLKGRRKTGILGASIFGLFVGSASITCTIACCGPLLPIVLGMTAARGQSGWGAMILTSFAVGYSIPLALVMLGVGLGRLTSIAQKVIKPIRLIAGILLIAVGFWLILTS